MVMQIEISRWVIGKPTYSRREKSQSFGRRLKAKKKKKKDPCTGSRWSGR